MNEQLTGLEVAVIGMSCRFPGADNVDAYWENLKNGISSLSFLNDEEINAMPKDYASHPQFVKSKGGRIDGALQFDAAFFGYTPNEAALMDPQTRIMHELVWEALEAAGYNSLDYKGRIGFFVTAGEHTLWEVKAHCSPLCDVVSRFMADKVAQKDYMGSLIAYKLNLTGPVVSLSTACSSSLVAVHMATRALLEGECRIAMAGGISVSLNIPNGYYHEKDMVLSSDGYCRAFDEKADGTVNGQGGAVVVLKRYEEALADGDNIMAVIKGTAVNNDGAQKIGYAAPGIKGQEAVVRSALRMAAVAPETISYVETHGTGTSLGDLIEIEALTKAFNTTRKQYCAIGAVKTNIGHTDTAAGLAGFIKTVLQLRHRLLVPSLHFEKPNPKINFANSPFYVHTTLEKWNSEIYPLRAGVSSFGIGGTNAHVVLEEYLAVKHDAVPSSYHVLSVAAQSATALQQQLANIAVALRQCPEKSLEDICYTLHTGRRHFSHRYSVVAKNREEIWEKINTANVVTAGNVARETPLTVLLFPGQGYQYINMGRQLYEQITTFREAVDTCAEILETHLQEDIRIYISGDIGIEKEEVIYHQHIAQPLMFVISYALTCVLQQWGIKPDAILGQSIGEYVAAFWAGVFELEEVLLLVAVRGKLMEQLPRGVMLYVPMPEYDLQNMLDPELAIATVNEPGCLVAGEETAISELERKLKQLRIITMRLEISHAGHSRLLDGMLDEFALALRRITLKTPTIPFVSNITGDWISAATAVDPQYWIDHIRKTVRLSDGLKKIAAVENAVYIEAGPGNTLGSSLARFYEQQKTPLRVMSLLQRANSSHDDVQYLYTKLSQLWAFGVNIDWTAFYGQQQQKKVALPTYPFDRKVFTLDELPASFGVPDPGQRKNDFRECFYMPGWKRKLIEVPIIETNNEILFINKPGRSGASFAECLQNYVSDVTIVDDWETVVNLPGVIVYFVPGEFIEDITLSYFQDIQQRYFYELLKIARIAGKQNRSTRLFLLTEGLHDVIGNENINPVPSTLLGLLKSINQEYAGLRCYNIDWSDFNDNVDEKVKQLLAEINDNAPEKMIAYRGSYRWVQTLEPMSAQQLIDQPSRIRRGGVYLLAGGLGNVGFVIAEYLATQYGADLIITGRQALPARNTWDAVIGDKQINQQLKYRISKIRKLEATGVNVRYHAADAADEDQMKEVIADALANEGTIHGVIYAVTDIGRHQKSLIADIEPSQVETQFRTKGDGLLILDRLTKDLPMDFFLLLSSVSAIFGGLGYAAYTSANIFMDAFVHYQRKKGHTRYISFNAPGWTYYDDDLCIQAYEKSGYNERMTFSEGVLAVETVLKAVGNGQVFIYLSDLEYKINNWVNVGTQELTPFTTVERKGIRRPDLLTAYIEPGNETERKLAALWEEVFGFDVLGIRDDFFEIGGDSLKAIKLIAKIEHVFHKNVLLNEFLSARTIEQIAQIISDKEKGHYRNIPLSEKRAYYELSSAQKRLYFLQKANPDSISYNEQIVISIRGSITPPDIKYALQQLSARHEAIRTCFIELDGIPYQVVKDMVDIEVVYRNSREDVHQCLQEFIRPFNLQHAPFLRMLVLTSKSGETIIMLDLHHLIIDGISFNIFKRELLSLLKHLTPPPVRLQYRDFSEWQRRYIKRKQLQVQQNYWQKLVDDGAFSELLLPDDNLVYATGDRNAGIIELLVDEKDTNAFRNMLKDNDVTLFNGILALLNVLFYRITGNREVCILSPVLGRRREELQDTIGIFINLVILRNYIPPDILFSSFMKSVYDNTIAAFEQDEYPFEELIKALKKRDAGFRLPEFNVLFTIKDLNEQMPVVEDELSWELSYYNADIYQPKYKLEIVFSEQDTQLQLLFIYDKHALKETTILRIRDYFTSLFAAVLKDADIPVSLLQLEHNINEVISEEADLSFGDFDYN
ncbi:polyketide synthase [Chitinophaga sp. 212800010-3]|uniref:polyketide synthase n=1 Tax=unclassified Chitinophaga TaxID=2619133 RepID=UPI002DEAB082|nr:polyketide synthase [Chitinophaga sp. 212800010-3]MEC5144140.1 KR domain-containing protein [Chitinophaga sp. 212800010-3]